MRKDDASTIGACAEDRQPIGRRNTQAREGILLNGATLADVPGFF